MTEAVDFVNGSETNRQSRLTLIYPYLSPKEVASWLVSNWVRQSRKISKILPVI